MIFTIAGLVAVLMTVFWPSIRSFLARKLIPFVRQKWGEKIAGPLASLTIWLNKKACLVRKGVAEAIRFVKTRILRMESRYVMTPDGNVIGTEIREIDNGDGTITRMTKPTTVDWVDLPQSQRAEFLRQKATKDGYKTGMLDEKELALEAAKEKLASAKKEFPAKLATESTGGMTAEEAERELEELDKILQNVA